MPLDESVDARELDAEVRADLRSLAKDTADLVARHLVMTGRLLDEDPAQALAHARAAGALAGRVGAVREAVGLASYAAGQWQEAVAELRTARRITGSSEHLAVLADCERALGRPERAIAMLDAPEVQGLEQSARVELAIVVAGARRDLGQLEAAVVLLQGPARATTARRPWAARLWYAYADALLTAGREEQAHEWFVRTAEVDLHGETDAAERLLYLDGVVFDASGGPAVEEVVVQVEELGEEPTAEQADADRALLAEIAQRSERARSSLGRVSAPEAQSEVEAPLTDTAARADGPDRARTPPRPPLAVPWTEPDS